MIHFSDDSDQGWRGRQKQQIAQSREMVENERNVTNMSSSSSSSSSISSTSSAIPIANSHANDECQKIIHKESSPPNIFNNSSSLKYLHKKFKRVASAVIDENNCDKVRTLHANNLFTTDNPLKYDAATLQLLKHNLNGETMLMNPISAVQSSHINESETNSQDVIVIDTVKCLQCRKSLDERQHSNKFCNECNTEIMNAAVKYGHGVLRNEFNKNDIDHRRSGAVTRTAAAAAAALAATVNVQHSSHKQYDTEFIDSLGKLKNDSSIRIITVSPLQQQKTNKHYELAEDFRSKIHQLSTIGNLPHKENSQHRTTNKHDLSVYSINNVSKNNNVNDAGSSSANVGNKSAVRRKSEKPYPCITCGIEFKSRSQYYKHCR